MDIEDYNKRATALNEQFQALRTELQDYALTEEGASAINAIDYSAVRKLIRYPGDITPARLVSVSKKLLK